MLERLVTVPFAQRLKAACAQLSQNADLSQPQRESAGIVEFLIDVSIKSGKKALLSNPVFGWLLALQHSESVEASKRFLAQVNKVAQMAAVSPMGELKIPEALRPA